MRPRDKALAWLGTVAVALLCSLTPTDGPAQADTAVDAAIHAAAMEHGVSEAWLRRVAWCESRHQAWVTSRGGHMGLFQYAGRTWAWMSQQAGWWGASPYDPWAAAFVTAWAFRNGYSHHWACR